MVEFRMMGYTPMDREYHEAMSETPTQDVAVEEPIFPISQLGATVPETDPTGRFRNLIQHTQAEIRKGAGKLQIVLTTPPGQPIGGRPKSMGKEVREALREVALASGVEIAGVEMPTAISNMSGFSPQDGAFSEELRKRHLDEVKDAIKFTADVGRGGGVDIVSMEFPRSINESHVIDHGKFEQVGEQPIGTVVDRRTGRAMNFRKTEILHLPYDPENFKEITELKDGQLDLRPFTWDKIVEWAKSGKARSTATGEVITDPYVLYLDKNLESQQLNSQGWSDTYLRSARQHAQQAQDIKAHQDEWKGTPEENIMLARMQEEENASRESIAAATGQAEQARGIEEQRKYLAPIDKYAFAHSTDSYAQAGIAAMDETHVGMARGRMNRPIHVGPELGWPQHYGSASDEFIAIVKKSRDRMVELMTNRNPVDPNTGQPMQTNPYFRPGISKKEAQDEAKKHIKGLFDTSHFGMWLSHFKGKPGETEEKRIERFNNWYKDEVEKIAKADVVGSMQLVDSMSGAHGHLPPGQGIFPVKEAAEIFKKHGFTGFMVSEGHEEEKYGEGRILTKLWQDVGGHANIGANYFSGRPTSWNQTSSAYFGRTYSPNFMFGSYAPSNEFRLWSEVPFE